MNTGETAVQHLQNLYIYTIHIHMYIYTDFVCIYTYTYAYRRDRRSASPKSVRNIPTQTQRTGSECCSADISDLGGGDR